jgi:hypothetical protein
MNMNQELKMKQEADFLLALEPLGKFRRLLVLLFKYLNVSCANRKVYSRMLKVFTNAGSSQ